VRGTRRTGARHKCAVFPAKNHHRGHGIADEHRRRRDRATAREAPFHRRLRPAADRRAGERQENHPRRPKRADRSEPRAMERDDPQVRSPPFPPSQGRRQRARREKKYGQPKHCKQGRRARDRPGRRWAPVRRFRREVEKRSQSAGKINPTHREDRETAVAFPAFAAKEEKSASHAETKQRRSREC